MDVDFKSRNFSFFFIFFFMQNDMDIQRQNSCAFVHFCWIYEKKKNKMREINERKRILNDMHLFHIQI